MLKILNLFNKKKKKERTDVYSWILSIEKKYWSNERISYEEFVLLAMACCTICFEYEQIEYQIDNTDYYSSSLHIIGPTWEKGERLIKTEKYKSIIDLLNKARINGKTIKNIWNEVNYVIKG